MSIFSTKIGSAILRPVERSVRLGWTNTITFSFGRLWRLAMGQIWAILLVSCATPAHLPSEQVHIKDSTVVNYIDSTVIHHKTRYKDFGGLLDTLKIDGERSKMRAWTDTTRNIIAGSLEEAEMKERIVYKDRLVYRDSVHIKEVPVEVEKIVEVVPKWSWYTLAFTVMCLVYLGLKVYFRFRG